MKSSELDIYVVYNLFILGVWAAGILEWAVFPILPAINGILEWRVYFASEDTCLLMQRRSANFRYTQNVISGFNSSEFPLFWKSPFKTIGSEAKFEYAISRFEVWPPASSYSNAVCMNSYFKDHFLLSVLSLGFFSSRKYNFLSLRFKEVPWSLQLNSCHDDFNLLIVLCFSFALWFLLKNK